MDKLDYLIKTLNANVVIPQNKKQKEFKEAWENFIENMICLKKQ